MTDKIRGDPLPHHRLRGHGFEHFIANWFFLPCGLTLDGDGVVSIIGVGRNLVAVTAGNMVGGTVLVAGVYWVAYLRGERLRKDRFPRARFRCAGAGSTSARRR